ncbi:HlyD family secretion protein [soil metagenome]
MQRKNLISLLVVVVVLAGVGVGGVYWWRDRQHYEATDNAYVEAETVSVTPQIEGYVAEVLVGDNQRVEAGQELVRLDTADPKVRLDQALAHLQQVKAGVRSVDDKSALEKAMIAQRAAGVTSAEADSERARMDMERYGALAKQGLVTEQKVQDTRAASAQGAAGLAQARAALEAENRSAQSLGPARAEAVAEVAAAESAVVKARADLDRTIIRAPVAGVVGARGVRPGQFVHAGGVMMAIVPVGDSYVLANFKETQVGRMRLGQPVQIQADAFGGEVIKGHIESFAPATGQQFALIPVENAVGNFTKIAQRLPVRIAIDHSTKLASGLRPGLSVKVRVDVLANTGPSFAESGVGEQHLARGAAATAAPAANR